MMPVEQKPARGCLFWGGIVAAIVLLFALLAGYTVYRYVKTLVAEYTDTRPMEIPVVKLSQTEITNLQQRIGRFDKAVKKNEPTEPLTLTADELNALIADATKTNPVPVRLYFSFNDNNVQAKLSLPTDGLGIRILKGRYFNGSGEFAVSLHDGRLMLNVKSLSVKGRPVPEKFMVSIRSQNFADAWTNDVQLNEALAKLQEVKVEDGKLIVTPKPPKPPEPKASPPPAKPDAEPKLEKSQARLEMRDELRTLNSNDVICCDLPDVLSAVGK